MEIEAYDCYIILGSRRIFERIEKISEDLISPPFFKFENFEMLDKLLSSYKNFYSNNKLTNLFFEGIAEFVICEISRNTEFIKKESNGNFHLVASILKYAEENVSSERL